METQTETYRDEINLLDYVKVIVRNKILICSYCRHRCCGDDYRFPPDDADL